MTVKLAVISANAAAQRCISEGCCREQRQDWLGAIEQYRRALALDAADPRVRYFGHNNLAYSLLQLGRFAEAEPHCVSAIEINGDQYNAHKNLGLALQGLGRMKDAAICLLNAARLAPGNTRAWLHLQKLLQEHPTLPEQFRDVAAGVAEVRAYYEANGGVPALN